MLNGGWLDGVLVDDCVVGCGGFVGELCGWLNRGEGGWGACWMSVRFSITSCVAFSSWQNLALYDVSKCCKLNPLFSI